MDAKGTVNRVDDFFADGEPESETSAVANENIPDAA